MNRSMRGLRRALLVLLCLLAAVPASAAAAPRELTLVASIQLALENNVTLKAAAGQRIAAVAKVEEVTASVKPKVSASGNYTRYSEPSMLTGSENDFGLGLSVSQLVYSGGALKAAVKAAEASLEAADLDLETRRQEVTVQVANGYYGLLMSERLVEISKEALANAEAHLSVVQASFEAGTVLKTDVLRTEVAVGQARQNLIKAQGGLDLARLGFLMTVGLPTNTEVKLALPSGNPASVPAFEALLRTANAKRPDLASARKQTALGEAGVAQARAGLLPSVTAVASENLRGSELSDLDSGWTLMLNASFNLFDWGAAKAKVTQAEANARGLGLRVKGMEDQLRLEVQQAYQALLEARERIPLAETSVKQAQENLEITKIRYEAGLATTVDVLDSQMLLTQNESASVQASFDYDLALVKLAKASGDTGLIK